MIYLINEKQLICIKLYTIDESSFNTTNIVDVLQSPTS